MGTDGFTATWSEVQVAWGPGRGSEVGTVPRRAEPGARGADTHSGCRWQRRTPPWGTERSCRRRGALGAAVQKGAGAEATRQVRWERRLQSWFNIQVAHTAGGRRPDPEGRSHAEAQPRFQASQSLPGLGDGDARAGPQRTQERGMRSGLGAGRRQRFI